MFPYYIFSVLLLLILLLFYYSLNNKTTKKTKKQVEDSFIMQKINEDKAKPEIEELKTEVDKLKDELNKEHSEKEELKKSDIKYKKITVILAIATVILLFWQVIIPSFVHGDTAILEGNEPITLEHIGWIHTSAIVLQNNGLGQSEDVELHIHYPSGISFNYDAINKSTSPKHDSMEIINDHECYYKWNYINSGEMITVTLDFSADSELGNYISPIDVSVRENKI